MKYSVETCTYGWFGNKGFQTHTGYGTQRFSTDIGCGNIEIRTPSGFGNYAGPSGFELPIY